MRFRCKEASDFKPNVWTGEKTNESFTAFKLELQNSVGALHASPRPMSETQA